MSLLEEKNPDSNPKKFHLLWTNARWKKDKVSKMGKGLGYTQKDA